MELCAIGLNHRTTPLGVREQLSISAQQIPAVLERLRTSAGLREAVVLSTCNRLEVYGVSDGAFPSVECVLKTIAAVKGEATSSATLPLLLSSAYVHEGRQCVQHLFRVASSLDSLVVGETEIVGQVKQAYQLAHASGTTGKVLNKLFQKALSVSKKVRTRSGIGRCSTSVGSVALDLATKIFGEDLSARTVLIIGAGKMGETTLKHLTKHGAKSVLVANRSLDRALELVGNFGGEALPFEDLARGLAKADVVISSTSAPHYVLGKAEILSVMSRRADRPLLLIDLAVPRDIDPAALQVPSVFLYNVDQLAELARVNLERRQHEAAACEQLLAQHVQETVEILCAPVLRPSGAEAGTLPSLQPATFGFA
jgi:glutamyl-tRNA reductase